MAGLVYDPTLGAQYDTSPPPPQAQPPRGQSAAPQVAPAPEPYTGPGSALKYDPGIGAAYTTPEKQPAVSPDEGWGSYALRMGEKLGEGVTFGTLPWLVAGARSLAGTPAEKSLQQERQYTHDTSEAYPIASTVAEGVGAIAPTVATFGAVNPLEAGVAKLAPTLMAKTLPKFLGSSAINAGVGAGVGAADAALHDIGQGTTENIGSDAVGGAEVGGAFGAAAPAIGYGAQKVWDGTKWVYNLLGEKGIGLKQTLQTQGGNANYILPGGTIRATPQQLAAATGKLDDAAVAGRTLRPGVTTADAADHIFGVANTPNPNDVPIPGYDRTLAQQTEAGTVSGGPQRNAGLKQMDSAYRGSDTYGPRFAALAHDQQSALTDTLSNPNDRDPIQMGPNGEPVYADPYAVGQEFTHQLDLLHQSQAADLAVKQGTVSNAIDALGQPVSATESGTAMKAAIDTQQAPKQAAADHAVADAQAARDQALAATPAGKQPIPGGATVAEQYGAEGRAQALIGQKASSDNVSRLYDIVGNPNTATAGLKAEVGSVYDGVPASAAPPKGEEAAIMKVIGQYPDNVPLSELTALRERVNDEISREVMAAGTTTTGPAKRLLATKSAIDNAINEPLAARAAAEGQAVQAGHMAPEDTMMARLQAERDAWQAQHGQGASQGASTAVNTPMTPEDAAALQAARAAAGKHAQTYQSGVVDDILQTGEHASAAKGLVPDEVTRAKGGFKTPDADVMAKVWNGRDTEAANLRAAQDAGITPELLKAHAADDLRATAVDENGNFDPKAYAKWRRDHAAGLHVFPEVKDAFDGMERAQATLAARQADADAVRAAHPLAGITDPANVPDMYMVRGDSGAAQVKQFVAHTGGDPAALQAFDDSFVRKAYGVPGLVDQNNGIVNARKLEKLTSDYSSLLSERPELAAKLKNIATAQDEVDRVRGEAAIASRAYQNGIAKNFLGGLDPLAAVTKVFNGPNSEANFRKLVDMTKGNPDAAEGLEFAVAKYMVGEARSAGMTNGGVDFLKMQDLQEFIDRNKQTLLDVFGNGQALNRIKQVMKELRIQSDLEEAAKHSPISKQTIFQNESDKGGHDTLNAGHALVGGLIGRMFHGIVPGGEEGAMLIGGTIKSLKRGFKQAGLKTMDDLAATMLVSPDTLQAWRGMVKPKATPLQVGRFVQSLVRATPNVTGLTH